jgi:7-keto-8-aminopelargonate synthetase-like enzyme
MTARASIFTASETLQVLDMLMTDSTFVERIRNNTERFRSQMTAAGFTIAGEGHPICPGDNFFRFKDFFAMVAVR